MNSSAHPQRIARLTAVEDVLAQVAALAPVATSEREAHDAVGRVLAQDLQTARAIPEVPVALRDGWAVRAQDLSDAGPYLPIPLPQAPPKIDAGAPLPQRADAIVPLDAIRITGGIAEAIMPATPGEGVLLAGGAAQSGAVFRGAGERLRPVDAAAAALAGIARVSVRAPRIALLRSKDDTENNPDPALGYLRRAIEEAGGEIVATPGGLDNALGDGEADAVFAVGGTGTGSEDRAVEVLHGLGKVAAHGIAIAPGETAAFGICRDRPVLLLPGRLDAMLAAWLLIGRPVISALAGAQHQDKDNETTGTLPLTRKISSSLGVTEAVLVRRDGSGVTPLAAGYFSLDALCRADGWVMVPPQSEGFPEGAAVGVRALPNLL